MESPGHGLKPSAEHPGVIRVDQSETKFPPGEPLGGLLIDGGVLVISAHYFRLAAESFVILVPSVNQGA